MWIDFEPHAGHEQAKERPALVLSEEIYNRRLWLAIMCPITTSRKPYRADLDIPIPPGVEIRSKDLTRIIELDGVIQADHIKILIGGKDAHGTQATCQMKPLFRFYKSLPRL